MTISSSEVAPRALGRVADVRTSRPVIVLIRTGVPPLAISEPVRQRPAAARPSASPTRPARRQPLGWHRPLQSQHRRPALSARARRHRRTGAGMARRPPAISPVPPNPRLCRAAALGAWPAHKMGSGAWAPGAAGVAMTLQRPVQHTVAMPADPKRGEHADDLAALRHAWRSMSKDEQAKALVTLHESYSARFLSDNARIWTTAASMIPLSLGAFVVLASMRSPALVQVVILSAAAWVLMSVWLIIAENHRAYQEGSQRVLQDIEEIWGFPHRPAKSKGNWLTGRGRVRQMRYVLWWAVTIGAVLVVLFWPGGVVDHL